MSEYRRLDAPDASIFFTVVTFGRRRILIGEPTLELLRIAVREEMAFHPFTMEAAVILPDHLHTIWTLPPKDSRFGMRWAAVKGRFTELFLATGGQEGNRNESRVKRGERSVWQRRFIDHVLRDEWDLARHMDYIHYNPVRHELAKCPHEWRHSSFERMVRAGKYPRDWMCTCGGRKVEPPDFGDIERHIE